MHDDTDYEKTLRADEVTLIAEQRGKLDLAAKAFLPTEDC